MPVGRHSSQIQVQATLGYCFCTSFLNVFVFCYRISLSEEQTIDIAMIEQLREAVDSLQDPNRYAYNSWCLYVLCLIFFVNGFGGVL